MLAIADSDVQAHTGVDDLLLRRIRAEFREMPGLRLSAMQARRLWSLEPPVCDAVLARLIDEGFVRQARDGFFVRADFI
jgi:hypothetical protein